MNGQKRISSSCSVKHSSGNSCSKDLVPTSEPLKSDVQSISLRVLPRIADECAMIPWADSAKFADRKIRESVD